jgi:N-acetylglucosaminyldiphosphoundecaprenol N-acetyl-beta-D-mannosaminyltransferase
MKAARYQLLGVHVDAVTHEDLHDVMAEAVAGNRRILIANHNLHSIYLLHHDPHFRGMYDRADCIYVDGMPIIFLGQALGVPLQRKHRTTFLDAFEDLVAEVARRAWRVF